MSISCLRRGGGAGGGGDHGDHNDDDDDGNDRPQYLIVIKAFLESSNEKRPFLPKR